MKRIIRILKRRMVVGTLILCSIGFGIGMIFNNYIGIGELVGYLLLIWWIFCFFTRNRKRKAEVSK